MIISKFFSKRVIKVIELFFANKKMLLSSSDILHLLKLDYKNERGNTERIIYSLCKMNILIRIKTSRNEIGKDFDILPMSYIKKFYYGLNLRNPITLSLEQLFIIIKTETDYHPDKRQEKIKV